MCQREFEFEEAPTGSEVCVLRLLVRKLPSLEAPVQGICHEHELLFEEPRGLEIALEGSVASPFWKLQN